MDSFLMEELFIGGREGNREGHGMRLGCNAIEALLAERGSESVPTPFVEVPLNVMEDSLLGTVDIESSLSTGGTVFSPGLLARCHRGVLYVDDINLLDEGAANSLLTVISDGSVSLEREGLSVSYPCRPLLVATYNPEEGELREHLLDRIGMRISTDACTLTVEQRVLAVDNVLGYSGGTILPRATEEATLKEEDEAEGVVEGSDDTGEDSDLREAVLRARSILPSVHMRPEQTLYLCEESTRAGCEGQRAEIFAAEAARASAALGGRTVPDASDLRAGAWLAIVPRGVGGALAATGGENEVPSPPVAAPDPFRDRAAAPPS